MVVPHLLSSLGPAFGLGFSLLTTTAVWQFLRAAELAAEARAALAQGDPAERCRRITELKGELHAVCVRAQVTTSCIPTLALLGTCLGFFYAMLRAAAITSTNASPLETLHALLDGGISTALGATVCGQGIYLVLSQVWALFLARRVEIASAHLEEALRQHPTAMPRAENA
jgi:hypothetical protein